MMSWLFASYDPKKGANKSRELYDTHVSSESALLADLTNKVIAITGTTKGGTGYFLACAAVKKNAKLVLLLNRESERTQIAEDGIKSAANDRKEENDDDTARTTVKTVFCDLASFASVRNAAKEVNDIAKENGGLDVLCNNAGVFALEDIRTEDGFDIQIQINHLSHVLLTKLVYESLELAARNRGEARVVMHSSGYKDHPNRNLEEKYFSKCDPGTLGGNSAWEITDAFGWTRGPVYRYHISKLANSAFAMEFHSRLKASGSKIKSLGCIPGIAITNVQETSVKNGRMNRFMANMLVASGQSGADGSVPAAVACFGPESKSGDFYTPEKNVRGKPIKTISEGIPLRKGGEKLTCDLKNRRIAWECSEKALGIEFSL